MGKRVTSLKAQKRNHQRINVYLDGEFAFGLSRFVAAWLQVGQELSEEKITELIKQDEFESAYQRTLKFISYRMRSVSEVQSYLHQNGIDDSTIAGVVERLQQNGLLDDANFAKMWIDNRSEFRPRSRRMLKVELTHKGIPAELISQTLQNASEDEEMVYIAARKQARKYKNIEWQIFQKRLSSYLARRGFSYSLIKPTVKKVWKEQQSENIYPDHEGLS